MPTPMTIQDVARCLNIRKHRLDYAIKKGHVPIARTSGRWHYFTPEEVRLLAHHFGMSVEESGRSPDAGRASDS